MLRKLLETFNIGTLRIPKDYFYNKPSTQLRVDYAIIRFLESSIEGRVAFKTDQKDEKCFFNATYITEHDQIDVHLRLPVYDRWHNLADYVDIDIYFPRTEVDKIVELMTKCINKT